MFSQFTENLNLDLLLRFGGGVPIAWLAQEGANH